MNKTTYIFVGLFLYALTILSQSKNIRVLDEVRLSDVKLKKYTLGAKKQVFKDSVSQLVSNPSLVNLLRFNSTAYFRENGIGGVTSIRLRGTGASQTSVVWNGIPINSQLNGQTDFSALSVRNYDNVGIRTGGGVSYGSSAIGGTISLNSELNFKKHFSQRISSFLGSFTTSSINYKLSTGSEKFSLNASVDQFFSKNDYKYLGKRGRGRRNENGELENYSFNLNTGVFLNNKHLLKLYHNSYLGKREFATSLFMQSDDDYRDYNLRNLLQWVYLGNRFKSTLSLGHIFEEYRFFPDKEIRDTFSYGKAANTIIKHDTEFQFSSKFKVKSILQFDYTNGNGSDIQREIRKRLSLAILTQYRFTNHWKSSFNFRQEINDLDRFSFKSFGVGIKELGQDFDDIHTNESNNQNPLVLSWDNSYVLNSKIEFKTSISNSFRLPTYNDLYWNGGGGIGNSNLLPERAIQGEVSQITTWKDFSFEATAYLIKTKNQIVWRPISSTIWSPINLSATENYGVEASLAYQKKWKSFVIDSKLQYAHTIAEDKELNAQVLFVPKNTLVFNTALRYERWNCFYQLQWNDKAFITTDNQRFLEARDVSNIGLDYRLNSSKENIYIIGLTINNLFNEIYELTAARPAPNRNYQFRVQLNF